MQEASAKSDLLMLEPSNHYFCSFKSAVSFSDPARSTMLSLDEIIGKELFFDFHSIES
jgi:hypothetical protein